MSTPTCKTYVIEKRIRGAYTNHNGHTERVDYWQPVATRTGTRAGKILTQFSAAMPGTQLRTRQINGGGVL